jgi:hypothetical protein
MKPVQIPHHGGRSKTDGPPLSEIIIDLFGPILKDFSGIIISTIMVKAVNSDFKPTLFKVPAKIGRRMVSFRYQAKRGPKSKFFLNLHQSMAILLPFSGLDIMRQNESKLFIIRPTRPSLRWRSRFEVDRPDIN